MHPMPREGTETDIRSKDITQDVMHPMPREGTETHFDKSCEFFLKMHPMPREGTETFPLLLFLAKTTENASYAP